MIARGLRRKWRATGVFLALAILRFFSVSEAQADLAHFFDRSHAIFFPPSLKETMGAQQAFPVFWWNFAALELSPNDPGWGAAEHLCSRLRELSPEFVKRVECGQNLADFQTVLKDWAFDLPLRQSRPSTRKIHESFDSALAKASLPSSDPTLIQILRQDPLNSWLELKSLAEKRLRISFPRNHGFFVDAETHRILIPLQMGFPPTETRRTAEFITKTAQPGWMLLGPHGSTLRNEAQVTQDTERVSRVGLLTLVLMGLALLSTRRWRLLLLVPPVLIAIGFSTFAVIFLHGSIHGLTLSFGTGIIGLAMDYGFHAALDGDQKRVWRSNLYGLLTTVVGLLVLMTSSVPLIRQLMEFSCIGLIVAWLIYWGMFKKFHSRLVTHPLPLRFDGWRPGLAFVLILVAFSFEGMLTLRPNFDIQKFNFQEPHTRELDNWLIKGLKMKSPLFNLHPGGQALELTQHEKDWADQAGILVENAATYLPSVSTQNEHLRSWLDGDCRRVETQFTPTERKFFRPFFDQDFCAKATPLDLTHAASTRDYLRHLTDGSRWITLWLPTTQDQELAIRKQHPDAVSLKEMVMTFPRTLERELFWMGPLSLLLASSILFFYYRKLRLTLMALTPFFTGLGMVSAAIFFLKLDTSFISVVAMILVFGFSIDYGIFATDLGFRVPGWKPDGVWSAVTLAALTMITGFVPLLFCRHPVLAHLGQTLFFGASGTYIGTVWGIPALRERR